jgi:hypothetical protein
MKHLVSIAALVLLMAGCGDGKKEAAAKLAAINDSITAARAARTVDLSRFDVPLLVDLGDLATLGVDSAAVQWNEEFGQLEVNAGERFGLVITEEPADIGRLKAELDRDMLRRNTVVQEDGDKLVYRSEFPDGDIVFVHFYQVLRVGDREFIVRDADQGRFSEADVARMAAAVRVKEAV